jgi:small subunit ribosomal protein S16
MAVTIRLRRMGAKSQPSYRLVVTDSRRARDGRFIETVGFYNPRREPAEMRFNEAKVMAWLERGARPSDTARSLLKKGGLWAKFTQGGVVAPERRQALAARKERASARRKERGARSGAARGAAAHRGARKKPARAKARSGAKKVAKKKTASTNAAEKKAAEKK